MRWIVISLVLSIALTVLLNAGLRAFPDVGRRLAQLLTEPERSGLGDDRRVRVFVPWKAVILISVVLTMVLNVLLWVR